MKYRSIILGVCAIVFATGSAFTFTDSNLATQVYVKIMSQQNPNPHCVATTLECSDTGEALCTVRIAIDDGSGTQKITDARKTTSCTVQRNSEALQQDFNPPGETVTNVVAVGQP